MAAQQNIERREVITSGYYAYILAHSRQPDADLLGVMDLTDPASWKGEETSTVYYFLITPAEAALRQSDPDALNRLAQKIQTEMPRSRFYSASSRKKMEPEELRRRAEDALKCDALEDDGAFDEWKKTLPVIRKISLPNTPMTRTHLELAKACAELAGDPKNEEKKAECVRLEKELGTLIFRAETLWAAMDAVMESRFAYQETAFGDVRIFSSKEIADACAAHYEEEHRFSLTVRELKREDIKPFFRACEEQGVLRYRLDDGAVPVLIARQSIIPDSNQGWLEAHNAPIRGEMLRTISCARTLQKFKEDAPEDWKIELNNRILTWGRMNRQDIANTALFVLSPAPDHVRDSLKGDRLFAPGALKNINDLMEKEGQLGRPIVHPAFKGHIRTMNSPNGKYSIRVLKRKEDGEGGWLMAFTSFKAAEEFRDREHHPDLIIGISLEELLANVGTFNGILLDFTGVGMLLTKEQAEEAIRIRADKRLIYKAAPKDQAPAAEKPAEALPAPAEEKPEEPAAEAAPAAEPAPAEEKPDGDKKEKGGFFGKFFGKK